MGAVTNVANTIHRAYFKKHNLTIFWATWIQRTKDYLRKIMIAGLVEITFFKDLFRVWMKFVSDERKTVISRTVSGRALSPEDLNLREQSNKIHLPVVWSILEL